MNWDAVGAIAEALGAFGVIVTLGYLAVQIRQNSRVVRLGNAQALLEGSAASVLSSSLDEGMCDVLRRASEGEVLKGTDAFRFNLFSQALLRRYQNVYYQHSQGMLDEVIFKDFEQRLAVMFETQPGSRQVFRAGSARIDAGFQAWLERILADPSAAAQRAGEELLKQYSRG